MPEFNEIFFLFAAKIACCLFFAILFLQSGLDKVFNYKTELSWITEHFSKSILNGSVPIFLPVLMLIELVAGGLSILGAVWLILDKGSNFAFMGMFFSMLALLMLFFGQRVAKDYIGAADIAKYFGVALLAVWIISL